MPLHLHVFEWFFFGYFIAIYLFYAILNFCAVLQIRSYLQVAELSAADNAFSSLDIPVSIIVPAYNESSSIVTSVRAMLQLEYPDYEVIVVNDGSKDDTLQKLIDEFGLNEFPEAYRIRVRCEQVRKIYRSARYPMLRVIDKVNGGSKSDAINAGINACRYPIFCAVDADSILQPDSLRRAVRPFLQDPNTVATGGTVRIANGCEIRGGFLERVRLPGSFLARIQVVEYLRAFLYGRVGWDQMNAVLIISGAFGLFDKEAVVAVGGYDPDAIGEDMELVLRLHDHFRRSGKPYRITFLPDPICWTDAPEDISTLKKQRVRWQHGLGQSIARHKHLLFGRQSKAVGWVALPFYVIFELFGPLVEIAGYFFMIFAALNGWLTWATALVFIGLAVGLGVMLSMSALVLEEMSFHVYPRVTDLLRIAGSAVIENFGYRQLSLIWRIQGLVGWLRGQVPEWGEMKRSASLTDR